MVDRFQRFLYYISEISRHWHKIAADEMEKHGLKGPHATYLICIYRHPDGITAPQISELCGKDKSDVSRTMALMEKKGIVTKEGVHQNLYRGVYKLTDAGKANYFIGTVEAAPSLDDVLAAVEATDATKVTLLPLMIVAGDHASNDMAGDEEGSWKDAFTKAGYEVECVLKGLGEYAGVQQILIDHAAAAISG